MPSQTKTITADLCPQKPDAKLLDVGDTKVTVNVTIEAKGPLPSSKVDRCVASATQEVNRYAQVISQEIKALEGKVRDLIKKNDSEGAKKMAASTSMSVQNAVKSIQGKVDSVVKDRLKKEAQGDKNLLEARVATVVKCGFKVVGIANKAFAVVASGGTAIPAWFSLAKAIYDLAKMVYEVTKGEKKLRDELLKAMGSYFSEKQRQVIEKEKADKSVRKKIALFAKEIYRKAKSKADAAEGARKKYRNEVTRMRQGVDKMFTKVAELEAKLKQAGGLKEGVQIGAKLMTVKRSGKAASDVYMKCEKFADDMAMLLTEAGVKVDDATFASKMSSLKNPGEMLSLASDIVSGAKGIYDLVDNIRTAA
jgi:hypothetical protein